jgi:N-acetylglutamate synthase-like GNAT family acetyltransferase
MSDERLDALAETARNRGLKLVRSRVRTPNKRRFGKVGLTDKNGNAVFGMDAKGPLANPEDVEGYLRGLGAKDWGASLDVAVLPRKRKATKQAPAREAANDREPAPKLVPKPAAPPKAKPPPKPKPEPVLKIRDAKPGDAAVLTELIHFLGHEIEEKSVRKNIKALARLKEEPLVATLGKQVVGLCGIHKTVTVHRDAPLGRITILVVAEKVQDQGIGRMLVEAAEQILRKAGCKQVEVTSNDRRTAAHAFYRHMGFERTSIRFFKKL